MPPPDQQLLEEIAELGRELTPLGWTPRLAPLREFYAAARAGRPQTERWSVSHLARLRAALGLGAAPARRERPMPFLLASRQRAQLAPCCTSRIAG